MNILFLGAGATGGYFGGRLAAAGANVTFLVRKKRAAELAAQGIVIESPFGNLSTTVKTATDARTAGLHDVVILSCKSYDLDAAIRDIGDCVGPNTLVVPLLNGLKHLDALDRAFGEERVAGGSCHLSVMLGEDRIIRHLNQLHLLTFGPRLPSQSERCTQLFETIKPAGFDVMLREDIMQAMWDKWVLLASLAGLTCLFRCSVGEIMATRDGEKLMRGLIEECRKIAAASGFEPSREQLTSTGKLLTDPASKVMASMLRDMQKRARIEADLIIGDMLRRGLSAGIETPLLAIANANLVCYENQIAPS